MSSNDSPHENRNRHLQKSLNRKRNLSPRSRCNRLQELCRAAAGASPPPQSRTDRQIIGLFLQPTDVGNQRFYIGIGQLFISFHLALAILNDVRSLGITEALALGVI